MEASPFSRRERRVRSPRALGVAVVVCAYILLAWMVLPPRASAAAGRESRLEAQLVMIDSLLATGHAGAADSASDGINLAIPIRKVMDRFAAHLKP